MDPVYHLLHMQLAGAFAGSPELARRRERERERGERAAAEGRMRRRARLRQPVADLAKLRLYRSASTSAP